MLTTARVRRAGWVTMTGLASGLALFSARYFTLDPAVFLAIQAATHAAHIGPVLLHVGGGLTALAVGPWQFWRGLRARRPARAPRDGPHLRGGRGGRSRRRAAAGAALAGRSDCPPRLQRGGGSPAPDDRRRVRLDPAPADRGPPGLDGPLLCPDLHRRDVPGLAPPPDGPRPSRSQTSTRSAPGRPSSSTCSPRSSCCRCCGGADAASPRGPARDNVITWESNRRP